MERQTDIRTLDGVVQLCKELRGFQPMTTLTAKIRSINKFFSDENLDTAVIGLSGGIDSTLVYYMLLRAASFTDSPIKKVCGLFLPIDANGVTGQDAAERCYDLIVERTQCMPCAHLDKIDLTKAAQAYYDAIEPGDDWVCGQIASIVRTPALYGVAAAFQKQGYKSLVVGTTNRDEGSYIGFFGKGSDGAVDLNIISDLHKSEVYDLASLLNVPVDIIGREPKGDVWDAKTDEEMMGCPYFFLEAYQILLEMGLTHLVSSIEDCPDAVRWAENIERMHEKNKHKYAADGSMLGFARHLDVLRRNIR